MRTYHAQATVRNGQLVLAEPLPQELEGQAVRLDIEQDAQRQASKEEWIDRFKASLAEIHEITKGCPVIPDEALRREYIYADDDEQWKPS